MINLIAWVLLGALLGWVASITLSATDRQDRLMNIGVGVVGATVTGGVLATILGVSSVNRNNFSIATLGFALAGAIILLVLLNFFRRGSLH